MINRPFITEARLVNLLKVDGSTLRRWRASGFLQSTIINKVTHYNVAVVNYFLANCEHNFDSPPTIDELLCGKVKLVRSAEACRQLYLSHFALLTRIHSNRLQAIKVGAYFRVCTDSIASYQHQIEQAAGTSLPQDIACHVFGVARSKLDVWVSNGKLQRISVTHHQSQQHIIISSVLTFLEDLLPAWVSPYAWLQSRLKDSRPLMNRVQLELYLRVPIYSSTLEKLIRDRKLWYICLPNSKNRRFLPKTADDVKGRFDKV